MRIRTGRSHFGAAVLVALLLAGCGTTVPTAQRGTGGAGDGLSAQTSTGGGAGTSTGAGVTGTSGTGGLGGTTSGGSTSGGTTGSADPTAGTMGSGTDGIGTSGGTTGVPTGPGTKGFGFDAKNVYIGVPTADDFNTLVKNAGANFDNGDVHADFDSIAADVNRHGGILGRKLVIAYHDDSATRYQSNPAQVAQETCAYFTTDRPVVAVINGFPQLDTQTNLHTCLEQKKVTLLSQTNTVYSDSDYRRLGPHLISGASVSTDVLVPTFVAALKRQGFFTGWNTTLGAPGNAPVKVGLLLPDDSSGRYVGTLFKAQLRAAGQQPPAEFYYPPEGSGAQSSSEVLSFKSAGVTHVLDLPPVELEIGLFQKQAETQHYRPRYGYTGFDLPLTVEENPAVAPVAQQVGSLGIGWQPLNDVNASKDIGEMPGGKRCFAALQAGGQKFSTSQRRAKFIAAIACDSIYLLQEAMVRAKGFTGDQILSALPVVGPRFWSASTFASVLTARDHGLPGFYRDSHYDTACSCFTYSNAVNRRMAA